MRAAILDAPGASLTIYDDVEAEAPHAGEVAVRVSHCGVCHSDLHLIDGGMPPMTPLVLGHEAAGVVEAIGPGVTTLAVGDHVVLTPCPPCGHCYWCLRGEHSICTNSMALATSVHPDGGTRLSRGGATVYRGLGVAAFAETVITQETGFCNALPTGRGLFGFSTMDDILAAVDAVNSNYELHCRAAAEIAREYFNYDVVLKQLMADMGIEVNCHG